MRIVMLLLIALALPSWAEPARRTQAALGLAPLDRGVSLWLVQPKTMIGVELERFELTWSELQPPSFISAPNENLTRFVRVSVSIKRFLYRDMFIYLRAYGQITHNEWDLDGQSVEDYNGGHNGPEIGFGYWLPFSERFGILVRQGVAWEKSDQRLRDKNNKETTALRLQAARLLMLFNL